MRQSSRATQIFTQLNDYLLTSDGARIGTGIWVDSGEITGFRTLGGSLGLLIPISEDEWKEFQADRRSPAIQLTRALEEIAQEKSQPFAQLSLLEPFHQKVFFIFVDELLSELHQHPERAAEKTALMLQRWRRFFSTTAASSAFGKEKQVGLLCELEVLTGLLEEYGPEAVSRWTGPESLPHDFELPTESIECKATTLTNGLRIGINGANQLTETPGKSLRLVVRRYTPDPDGQLSIPDLCRTLYEDYPISVEEFLDKLDKIGCPVFHPESDIEFLRFNADLVLEFIIDDSFPRIQNYGLDPRIINIQYTLDLTGFELIPGYQTTNKFIKE